MARRGGKPQNFSDAQSDILRRVAREYIDRNQLGQVAFGEQIDVGQQAISSFMSGKTSLSYPTASKLAMLTVGEGVDALFARYGSAPFDVGETDHFPERAKALLASRLLSVDEDTLQRIKTAAEWNRAELAERPAQWWFEQIRAEQSLSQRGYTDKQLQNAIREESARRRERKSKPRIDDGARPSRTAKQKVG